jgi:hypothetical protein
MHHSIVPQANLNQILCNLCVSLYLFLMSPFRNSDPPSAFTTNGLSYGFQATIIAYSEKP